ncbi:beta-glucosidase BglX [Bordetella sp. FB-8]|uniref:beta-glucosidase BglX n=1 Tax=Bordetella sp. FB-8 TaxID=1159870 RepID=UPI0003637FE6|nr:beta-glucosidase BglX [Bordetella sp. FB-8]
MNRLYTLGVLLIGLAGAFAAAPLAVAQPSPAFIAKREAFIDQLMKRMTVQEKIGQLRLRSLEAGAHPDRAGFEKEISDGRVGGIFNTVVRPDIRVLQEAAMRSRLKIPLFFSFDVIHGQRTLFPVGLGLASTWDLDAVHTMGRISAIEASADGLNLTYSPMVDISRDPRWGRNSEGFGEDTYLTSRIGAALVKAYQGDDPSQPGHIMATVKHFALYGAVEGGRDYNTVDMSPQRMYQDYFPPYKAAIDAGAAAVMIALNSVNGEPATSDKWLLQDVLRKEWGFKGITISDHGAIMELIKHGVAADGEDAARKAVQAGTDMSMSDTIYGTNLMPLLKSGKIGMADIDRACRDVLRVKYDLGLFKDPYRNIGTAADDLPDSFAESRLHRPAAREVARESLVLLKNQGSVLPLKKAGTIALVGPLADDQVDMMGNWAGAGRASQTITLRQGIQNIVGGKVRLIYAKGSDITDDPDMVKYLNLYKNDVQVDGRSEADMVKEAVDAARQADVIVAAVGESQGMAHEASSRSDITIPPVQERLLKALKATGKPLIIVLMNGRPLALPWEAENADAMLETWFSGTEGGNAIADVLFGDMNPSGKLPVTFPRAVGQIPLYYNHLPTGRPFDPAHPDKYTSRYFDITNGPLYPFGYGLSYTNFSVSDIKLSAPTMKAGGMLKASVTVTNTGDREGATVVQLYLNQPVASISRPVQELRGFRRIDLKPGQSREVSFDITDDDLAFYNQQIKRVVEPGKFNVYVGLDSASVKATNFYRL